MGCVAGWRIRRMGGIKHGAVSGIKVEEDDLTESDETASSAVGLDPEVSIAWATGLHESYDASPTLGQYSSSPLIPCCGSRKYSCCIKCFKHCGVIVIVPIRRLNRHCSDISVAFRDTSGSPEPGLLKTVYCQRFCFLWQWVIQDEF